MEKNKYGYQIIADSLKTTGFSEIYVRSTDCRALHWSDLICESDNEIVVERHDDMFAYISSSLSVDLSSRCFFVGENCINKLEKLKHSALLPGASAVFLIFGAEGKQLEKFFMTTGGMGIWYASHIEDLFSMIPDAKYYSERCHFSSSVYIPSEMVFSKGWVDYSGFVFRNSKELLKRCYKKYGNGPLKIGVYGDCIGFARKYLRKNNLVTLHAVSGMLPGLSGILKNVPFIYPASANPMEEEEHVIRSIRNIFPLDFRFLIKGRLALCDFAEDAPEIDFGSGKICPGCISLIHINRYMERHSGEKIAFLQNLYCKKKSSIVSAGFRFPDAKGFDSWHTFVSFIRKHHEYRPVVFTDSQLPWNDYEQIRVDLTQCCISGKKPFVRNQVCILCGRCMERSGCSALSLHRTSIEIDMGKCSGCGLCMGICGERRAICVE